jgi:hypothetical protein
VLAGLAAPLFGAAVPVDDVALALAPGTRGQVAVASTDTQTLAVWGDSRADSAIFATYIDRRTGAALDPAGIRIGSGYDATVAALGSTFVFAWTEWSESGYRTRLAQLVDHSVRLFDTTSNSGSNPRLAWNGESLALLTTSGFNTVEVTIFDANFRVVLDRATVGFSSDPAALAPHANGFIFLWMDKNAIFAQVIHSDGSRGTRYRVFESPAHYYSLRRPDIIKAGDSYLVTSVYLGTPDGKQQTPLLRRLALDGTPLSDTVTVETDSSESRSKLATVDGRYYLASFHDDESDDGEIRLRHIERLDLPTLSSPVTVARCNAADYDLAESGHDLYLVHLRHVYDHANDPYGQRTATAGTLISAGLSTADQQILSLAPRAQHSVHVVTQRAETLVIWTEMRGDFPASEQLVYRRLNAAGEWLEPSSVVLAAAPLEQQEPAVATNGETTMIVWKEGTPAALSPTIRAALLHEGRVFMTLDLGPTAPASSDIFAGTDVGARAAVAARGNEFLVVWEMPFETGTKLVAQRFGIYGVPVDPLPVPIAPFDTRRTKPAIVATNAGYTVAMNVEHFMTCRFECDPRTYAVEVMTLGSDGMMTSAPTLVSRDFTSPPHLATTSTETFVFFDVWYDLYGETGTRYVRVAHDGTLLDSFDGIRVPELDFVTAASFDGERVLAAGMDRNAVARIVEIDPMFRAQRTLWRNPYRAAAPLIGSTPSRRSFVVFEHSAPEAPFFGVSRLYLDWLSEPRSRPLTRSAP